MLRKQYNNESPPLGGYSPKCLFSFTLIELLVVISIIAILMSMLLPSLKRARDKGLQITCSGNMKQIASAFMQYVGDQDGFLPKIRDPRWYYDEVCGQYMGGSVKPGNNLWGPQVILCPAYKEGWAGSDGGIGACIQICGIDDDFPRKLVHYETPSEKVCVQDVKKDHIGTNRNTHYFNRWEMSPDGVDEHFPMRHSSGSNITYLDGHVDHCNYTDIGNWTDFEDRYKY